MVAAQPPSGGTIGAGVPALPDELPDAVADGLPHELALVLDPGVRRLSGGRALLGGSPLRVLRLSEAGSAIVERLAAGERLPARLSTRRLVDRLLDGGLAHPRLGTARRTPSEVTVVVPVRDRPIGGLVATLAADVGSADRVIVVDDGSTQPLGAPDSVVVVRRHVSGGPAAARNAGWAAATTALVAFVDSDCRPAPGWLDRLLPHFNDERVGLAAPRIVDATHAPGAATATFARTATFAGTAPEGSTRPGGRVSSGSGLAGLLTRYEAVHSPLDLGPAEGRIAAGTRISYVPAAALVVRRSALEAVGGFAEDMSVGEDVDLVWRLAHAGWRARYEPTATVAHAHRVRPRAWLRRRFEYGSSAAPLAKRHPGALAPLAVSGWSVAAWTLLLAGRPRSAALVAGATTALLVRKLRRLPDPLRESARLGLLGHLGAGRAIATALTRTWLPALLVAATVSRTARRALLGAAIVPAALEWNHKRPKIDPLAWTALVLADDASYCAGVWWSCWRHRTLAPLVPDLRSWPGRTAP